MEIKETPIAGILNLVLYKSVKPIYIVNMTKVKSYDLAILLDGMSEDEQFLRRGEYLIII